ncbi:leucyl aminopeptidase [filamentous cyanobacterium LEGE 11480]|uniref:Probable cytosol aminopeptidase n=1 Tax=Romeriopsis navalis LEGE 11480 TaxID=2777977 RepID=A0A928VL34_9CYAN|nr:leucyl aminopeptidase [Romeriopsis navalis]MBE9030583.1 leucyl aminopeptidase [Romeriopsis navalis LEGE 11480]
MKFEALGTSFVDWTGDGLAIGVFEDQVELSGDLATLDGKLSGMLSELINEAEFKGKANSSLFSRVMGGQFKKLIVLGLGKTSDLTSESLRRAAATAAKLARREKCQTLGIHLPTGDIADADAAQAITEGMHLALYKDVRFKSEKKDASHQLTTVQLLGLTDQAAAIAKAEQICQGVFLARELVAAPANYVTPMSMADMAQELAQTYGLELQILEQAECEALGMGAFLGVAMASDMPPKFIHLTYKPAGTPRKKLAIVGKGLTFDSGGYNLKVGASSIEMMKTDMGGAGATFGAAKAIAALKPDVEVHFISAVTENMVSGRGMHPGDILTASNGKTIEINNTDAEGRLTLADALVYADKLGVDGMVDLATLTGACVVALGNDIAGLWSPNDQLADDIVAAAKQSGEKIWRMPMEEKYFDSMKSPLADMKNTGARAGGAISASVFLKQYVKETPWAHIDLAGPVWTDKDNGYNSVGATGYAVRMLVDWVMA